MIVFEQMVIVLMTYGGKPLSPRKINIHSAGRLPH